MRFTPTPMRMGVLLSPAARSTVPKRMVQQRGSMGR